MNKERLCELFKALISDKAKARGPNKAADLARSIKPNASIREILLVAQKLDPVGNSVTPGVALEFVRAIVEKTGCERLYLPFAVGVDADELRSSVPSIDYVLPTIGDAARVSALGELILEKTGIERASEEVVDNTQYDVVYADLALNVCCEYGVQQAIVTRSVDRLSPNGLAIFTFADKIIYWDEIRKWFDALSTRGVFVSANIDLTGGLYESATPIGAKTLVFSRKKSDSLFFAKLEKGSNVSLIVDNYLNQTSDPDSEASGRWVGRDAFPDFISYENERRRQRISQKLEQAYDGKTLPVSEISVAVVDANDSSAPLEEAENAVYVPKQGKSDAATNLNELPLPRKNYVQILTDQEKVLPEFLKFFLNTDQGAETRALSSAGVNCALTVEHIEKLEIPVPSLETQRRILQVYDELNQIELEASRLKNKL